MKRTTVAIVLLATALVLTSCSLLGSANLGGEWSVTMTNLANNNYVLAMTFDLTQSGNSLSGSAYIEGYYVGSLSGSVSGSSFSLHLAISSEVGGGFSDITGKANGDTLQGNYTASGGGYGPVNGYRLSTASLPSSSQRPDISAILNALRDK